MNGSQRGPAKTAHPVLFGCLSHPDGNRLTARDSTVAFLLDREAARCRRRERAINDELLVAHRERHLARGLTYGQGAKPESVDERVREHIAGLGEGPGVQHQRQMSWALRAGERVEIGDVRGGLGQRPWALRCDPTPALAPDPAPNRPQESSRRPRPATASTPDAARRRPRQDCQAPAGRPRWSVPPCGSPSPCRGSFGHRPPP